MSYGSQDPQSPGQGYAPYPGSSSYSSTSDTYSSGQTPSGPVYPPQQPPKSGCGGCGCWLTAFLVLLLIAILACAGVAWYVAANAASIGADIARSGINSVVQESQLPAEEKQAIMKQVDRVVKGVKQGDITFNDFTQVAQKLEKSPLLTTIMVMTAEEKYIKPSGLTDEEKEAARLAIRRLVQGVVEEKISQEDLKHPLEVIMYEDAENKQQLKERISDEELREFVKRCKDLADTASVAEDPAPVKISDEIKKLIEESLGDKLPPE